MLTCKSFAHINYNVSVLQNNKNINHRQSWYTKHNISGWTHARLKYSFLYWFYYLLIVCLRFCQVIGNRSEYTSFSSSLFACLFRVQMFTLHFTIATFVDYFVYFFFFSLIHYRFWIHFACNLCYFYYCLLLGSLQIKRYVSKHSRTNGCDTTEAKQTQFNISFANIFFFFFAIRFLDTWFEITDCSQVSVCIFPPMICLSVEETIAKYRWWITHLIR